MKVSPADFAEVNSFQELAHFLQFIPIGRMRCEEVFYEIAPRHRALISECLKPEFAAIATHST